jgi:hypothetical protein
MLNELKREKKEKKKGRANHFKVNQRSHQKLRPRKWRRLKCSFCMTDLAALAFLISYKRPDHPLLLSEGRQNWIVGKAWTMNCVCNRLDDRLSVTGWMMVIDCSVCPT